MPKPPRISEGEWEIMNVLWESDPLGAAEVAQLVHQRTKWHPNTVKTLLGRLVKKGAVRYREEANRYLYRPAFPRERFVKAESRSFMARVFGGNVAPAVVQFVRALDLSDEDVDDLREMLEQRKADKER